MDINVMMQYVTYGLALIGVLALYQERAVHRRWHIKLLQLQIKNLVILTQEGYDKIEKELEFLRTEKRTEIAERIKVALGFGDLSENSEYDEAKNAQAENEGKIAELENKIRHAKIIDEAEIDTKTVQIGNTVKLYDVEFEEEVEYTIVGSTEVNLAENKISNESPIGKALLEVAAKNEQRIDDMQESLLKGQIERMQSGKCSAEAGVILSEMLTDFERIGDHALNIAEKYQEMQM